MNHKWAVAVGIAVLAVFSASFATSGDDRESEAVISKHRSAPVLAAGVSAFTVDLDEQYALAQDRQAVAAYLAAVHQHELDVEAWNAGEARLAAELAAAAAAARARVTAPRVSVGSTVGSCTGFAIPDYIIQRESGGNPSAYNPSGAYGCAQTLLSHYSSGGACAGLNPYTIDGQRQCVWILSSGGSNLSPWAATR